MKIALFGASGTIGGRILREALDRGHEVTAVLRDPAKLQVQHPRLRAVAGEALDPASIATAVAGQDAVISAIGPGLAEPRPGFLVQAAHSLLEGLGKAGVTRLLVVGGAGSLEVAPGLQLVDAPSFPEAWKGVALEHREAFAVFRKADLDWSYFSPAAFIQPGERTGHYRLGGDQLLTDAQGESRISAEDYAVALLDELEQPKHLRKRFTAAY